MSKETFYLSDIFYKKFFWKFPNEEHNELIQLSFKKDYELASVGMKITLSDLKNDCELLLSVLTIKPQLLSKKFEIFCKAQIKADYFIENDTTNYEYSKSIMLIVTFSYSFLKYDLMDYTEGEVEKGKLEEQQYITSANSLKAYENNFAFINKKRVSLYFSPTVLKDNVLHVYLTTELNVMKVLNVVHRHPNPSLLREYLLL